MLQLLNTIVQWIVTGIQNIITIITQIPVYSNIIRNTVASLPVSIMPFVYICISVGLLICIKRLVF